MAPSKTAAGLEHRLFQPLYFNRSTDASGARVRAGQKSMQKVSTPLLPLRHRPCFNYAIKPGHKTWPFQLPSFNHAASPDGLDCRIQLHPAGTKTAASPTLSVPLSLIIHAVLTVSRGCPSPAATRRPSPVGITGTRARIRQHRGQPRRNSPDSRSRIGVGAPRPPSSPVRM